MKHEEIRQRVIDRAAKLYSKDNPNRGELFTTAHYAQALKAEFATPGPTLDSATCTKHLEAMDDIEKAGGCIWRRKAQHEAPVQSDITECTRPDDKALLELEARIETGVLRLLSGDWRLVGGHLGANDTLWWTIETVADALKNNNLVWDGLLENLVGLVLYTMAVDGRVVVQHNILLDGERRTVFTLTPKSADVK